MPNSDQTWLEPIRIALAENGDASHVNGEIRRVAVKLGYPLGELNRCVYVIRSVGDVLISYGDCHSYVMYIGRGVVGQRLADHLRTWIPVVSQFGNGTKEVEFRICIPRRRGVAEYYKYVEADLINMFGLMNDGCLPFFNRQRQRSHVDEIEYNRRDLASMRRSLGIGQGNRPKWAIKPIRTNRHLRRYECGGG